MITGFVNLLENRFKGSETNFVDKIKDLQKYKHTI